MLKLSKISRTRDARNQVINNLLRSLLEHEKITTTASKAQLVKPYAEKLLSLSKKDDHNSKRLLAQKIENKKLYFKVINSNIKSIDKTSGFIKSMKSGMRKGDNAPLVTLIVDPVIFKKEAKEIKKTKDVK